MNAEEKKTYKSRQKMSKSFMKNIKANIDNLADKEKEAYEKFKYMLRHDEYEEEAD